MPRPVRQSAGSPGKNAVACPICGRHCSPQAINTHLDKCLSKEEDSSPPRKRSKQDSYAESDNEIETEPLVQPGQLNAEWAAILKNKTKEEKKTPKSEKKKKEKKKSKKSSTQSSSGDGLSTPKKAKSEKGTKSEKSSTKKEKREKSTIKGEKKKKRKRKHKEKADDDDDVFDFDADEMEVAKKKVSTDGTPNKTTPSKTTLNDKNVTPTHKNKSPSSSQSPKKSAMKSPFTGLSPKQASQSFWARQNAQSTSPNYQAMKFNSQTPPAIAKGTTIQTPPTAKTNAQSPTTTQSTKPAFGTTPSQPRPDFRPLAERMRPYTMDTLIGQNKTLGATGTLRRLLDAGNIPSMIFWGPPGCGKTSLANVIARQAKLRNTHRFITFSATTSNVSDVKSAVEIARNEQRMYRRKTILFIDEIHRFNKTQQDTFLLHVENGTIILIGATTENPSFRVNNALLSRCRVVVLEKLSPESIMLILERALKDCQVGIVEDPRVSDALPTSDQETFSIERQALCLLANLCDGDARSALNSLQMVLDVAKGSSGQLGAASKVQRSNVITVDQIKDSLQRSHISYDKSGEEHYNCASALQKSIRASDANAAVYWLGRMLVGGEDPLFIARRLVVCASEDIGLADSQALVHATATYQACQNIGMPECELNLAHCVIYLSRAPKSRQVPTAYSRVKECLKNHQGPTPPVPLHLQTPATQYQLVRNTLGGWGKGRVMAGGYQGYMPESLAGLDFFSMST
ncbi:ATPase WRNIP1-like [Lytechinus variegatus]|uniref:ATPase WRNIP1-like n=1 Tax=Lytechinus variegatus TaxID=7654 RepID=UPI001BB20AAC|nr:ATPase WRNIP1-like [Lytechinus variegatus]